MNDKNKKSLEFIVVMSELGAGTRGASLGYDGLVAASHKLGFSTLNDFPTTFIETENKRLFKQSSLKWAKHLDGINQVYESMAPKIGKVLNSNRFPLVISGAHSVAAGTIKAIKSAYPEKRLGVIWIDAHADLHSPYTTPSGNVHGMPLGIALKEDNLEQQRNIPSATTIAEWEKACGDEASIKAEDLIFFGVRDTEIPEDELIERKKIKNFTVEEVRRRGVKPCAVEALAQLAQCDLIYISFDVDSMDSAISDGTGTPVINGFAAVEAEKLIRYLICDPKVCCFEMVEINPTLDTKGNVMAETAMNILRKVIGDLTM